MSFKGICVIIDFSLLSAYDLNTITTALRNVVSLVQSSRGCNYTFLFSLYAITSEFLELYELNQLETSRIFTALESKLFLSKKPQKVTQNIDSILAKIMQRILTEFGRKTNNSDLDKLQIVLISCKNCNILKLRIEEILKQINSLQLSRLKLVEIDTAYNRSSTGLGNSSHLIKVVRVQGTITALETIFKKCFFKHVHRLESDVTINFPENSNNLVLHCDLKEIMLDPITLPYGYRYQFQKMDASVKQSKAQVNKTRYHLQIMSTVSNTDISEVNTFGRPVLLEPTKSWNVSSEERTQNRERFLYLVQTISKQNMCLVAKFLPNERCDCFRPLFALFPYKDYFLVKPFLSQELKIQDINEKSKEIEISPQNANLVRSALQNVSAAAHEEVQAEKTGLYEVLVNELKKIKTSDDIIAHKFKHKRN